MVDWVVIAPWDGGTCRNSIGGKDLARQECCVKCSRKWIKIQQDQANLIPISLLLSKFQQIWCYRRKYMEHDRKGQEWLRKNWGRIVIAWWWTEHLLPRIAREKKNPCKVETFEYWLNLNLLTVSSRIRTATKYYSI